MIRWQPLPTLRIRLQRADPGDLAVAGCALAIALIATLAVGGLLARLATLSTHGA